MQTFLDTSVAPKVADGTRSPKTLASYQDTARLYVLPYLGALRLDKVTADHLDAWLATLQKEGKSPRVRQLAFGLVKQVLGRAARRRVIPFNPADMVEAVEVPKYRAQVWTEAETLKFLRATSDEALYPLYLLTVTCGLRMGELVGLRRASVDLEAGVLYVTEAMLEVDGKHVGLAGPKTESGVRALPLPATVRDVLAAHLGRVEGSSSEGYVFPNSAGHAYLQSNLRRAFKKSCVRAGVPEVRFHGLRHLSASLANHYGVSPKTLQGRLGHSKMQMTMDVYTHEMDGAQREASELMQSRLLSKLEVSA
jgi:integrase